MNSIIEYLKEKYSPRVIIQYGSFSNGTNNESSDYDAIIITDKNKRIHDSNIIGGIQLDVFIYSIDEFQDTIDPEKFITIYEGKIILDTDGLAKRMMYTVKEYVDSWVSTYEKDLFNIRWCKKMKDRSINNTTEGYYRWHLVLTESLEIYSLLCDRYYFGPKKTLSFLEENDSIAFELYTNAITKLDYQALCNWIKYIEEKFIVKYEDIRI